MKYLSRIYGEGDILEVALCTGLRANELKQLRVRNLDPDDSCLRFEAEWTKNRKEGFQPLPRRLLQRLLEHSNGKESDEPLLQVSSHPVRDRDKDLAAAGIEKRVEGKGMTDFHALRVACTTFLREAGADIKEAQTLARHSDPRLTMNISMRTRDEGLSAVTENVADMVLGSDERNDSGPGERKHKHHDDDDGRKAYPGSVFSVVA